MSWLPRDAVGNVPGVFASSFAVGAVDFSVGLSHPGRSESIGDATEADAQFAFAVFRSNDRVVVPILDLFEEEIGRHEGGAFFQLFG